MTHHIDGVDALEVLDSRGAPTLQVTVTLGSGVRGVAGVPSGASTGSLEAIERRDGDSERYGGRGVEGALSSVRTEIAERLRGRAWESLAAVDAALIELDGTPNKARLGANAIVGVSMAAARAFALEGGQALWRFLLTEAEDPAPRIPVPHFNVINGGAHARNRLEFQEFMIAPLGAPTLAEAMRAGAETYAALRALLADGGQTTGLGDEGGFAPDLTTPEQALDVLVAAIEKAGYEAAVNGIAIALDPAASGFRDSDGRYWLAGERLTSTELIQRYVSLADRYPIWSLEDGLGEDDWEEWALLTARLGTRLQLVGDDIFVTSAELIAQAAKRNVANAALIKVNQVGTVTETLQAVAACRSVGYRQMVSHRSGETPDPFIADLAVAIGCGQIKSGAPARGERVAKYNRLLEIEVAEGSLPFGLAGR